MDLSRKKGKRAGGPGEPPHNPPCVAYTRQFNYPEEVAKLIDRSILNSDISFQQKKAPLKIREADSVGYNDFKCLAKPLDCTLRKAFVISRFPLEEIVRLNPENFPLTPSLEQATFMERYASSKRFHLGKPIQIREKRSVT